MTYDEYMKYMDDWKEKEKAAGGEILEIIKKYNLSAGEAKFLLKDLKKAISNGSRITDETVAIWKDPNYYQTVTG